MLARKSPNSSWRRATPSGQQCGQRLTRTRLLTCWLWVMRCQVRMRWPATQLPPGVERNCAGEGTNTADCTVLLRSEGVGLSLQRVQWWSAS
jgi:hypothetical protein